jgi:hypothetical protein
MICRDISCDSAFHFAGIYVAKDLAIVVSISTSGGGRAEYDAIKIYSHSDGRAFRGCPYWKHWISKGFIYTHDTAIEEIDFGRVISDFCNERSCRKLGYTSEQLPKLVCKSGIEALAIPKDYEHNGVLLDYLNQEAAQYRGFLFEPNSPMQYMWTSLPVDESGKRHLPTAERPATARYDGVRALLNAMAVSDYLENHLRAAKEQEIVKDEFDLIGSFFQHECVWLKHPIHGVVKLPPREAAFRMTDGHAARFLCYGTQGETTCPVIVP